MSDSTGETVSSVARACLVQYEGIFVQEHVWSLVRSPAPDGKSHAGAIERDRGPVLYTLVDPELRDRRARSLPAPAVALRRRARPGDERSRRPLPFSKTASSGRDASTRSTKSYFDRIDAMHYTLAHDDGQSTHDLEDADVILVGPSRTSKTPTCVYLANRGVRAANVPLVPAGAAAGRTRGGHPAADRSA